MNILEILGVLWLISAAIFLTWVVANVLAGAATRRVDKRGHRPTAFGCIYWTGDRTPLDLGQCPTCGPYVPDYGSHPLLK